MIGRKVGKLSAAMHTFSMLDRLLKDSSCSLILLFISTATNTLLYNAEQAVGREKNEIASGTFQQLARYRKLHRG